MLNLSAEIFPNELFCQPNRMLVKVFSPNIVNHRLHVWIYLTYPLYYRVEHGVGGDVTTEPVPGQRRAQPGEVQQPRQRQRGGGGGLGAGQGHRAEPDVMATLHIVDNF